MLPGVGTNRYAYSYNDPVNFGDPSGHGKDGAGDWGKPNGGYPGEASFGGTGGSDGGSASNSKGNGVSKGTGTSPSKSKQSTAVTIANEEQQDYEGACTFCASDWNSVMADIFGGATPGVPDAKLGVESAAYNIVGVKASAYLTYDSETGEFGYEISAAGGVGLGVYLGVGVNASMDDNYVTSKTKPTGELSVDVSYQSAITPATSVSANYNVLSKEAGGTYTSDGAVLGGAFGGGLGLKMGGAVDLSIGANLSGPIGW
jgi:hypothetical protein